MLGEPQNEKRSSSRYYGVDYNSWRSNICYIRRIRMSTIRENLMEMSDVNQTQEVRWAVLALVLGQICEAFLIDLDKEVGDD